MRLKTLALLSDDLLFQSPVEIAARQLGYQLALAQPVDDVVAWLVERQPELILVDLSVRSLDWHAWVLAAKTSPATRKMPILAFGSHKDAATLERARRFGCDAVVSNGAFMADVPGMIQRHARPDQSDALSQQAQQPLPALARRAIEQFNRGEFWEQHETFEHLWRQESGPVRQMYQGILQVGVAYYQIQRRNYVGARRLFQRAWQYLNVLPDVCQGVDIAALRADAQAAFATLEQLGPERIAEFDPALLKPIRLVEPGASSTQHP